MNTAKILFGAGGAKMRVIKGASILGAGAMISQAIYVAALPLATWFYSPEAFGYFGSFSSFAAIFAFAGCLSYQGVFFLVDNPRKERALVAICVAAATLVAMVGALLSVGWSTFSPGFGGASIGMFAVLLLLAVWPRSLMVGLQAASVKRGDLINASAAQILRTVTIVLVWLVPAAFLEEPSRWLLIIGFTLGSWVGLGVLLRKPLTVDSPDIRAEERGWPRFDEVRALAKRYWRFPAFEAPAVMLRQMTQYGPVLLYASFYGPVAAGFVALATQAVIRPTTTVTQSLGDAIRREYGERLRAKRYQAAFRFLWQVKLGFAVLGVSAGVALWFLAVPAAEFVLPREWLAVAPALAVTAPRLAAMILIRPSIMLASLNERQSSILSFEIAALVATVSSIVGGWLMGFTLVDNLLLYASIFAAVGVVFVLAMLRVQARDLERSPQ